MTEHNQLAIEYALLQIRARVHDLVTERDKLRATMREILDEAEGDFDHDIIITAARDALKEVE